MSEHFRGLSLVLVFLASCSDPVCDRPECDTFSQRAKDNGQSRLAGAMTDYSVFPDGCKECLFRVDDGISVWSKTAPPDFVEHNSPPAIASTSPVDGLFSLELAPGSYVVCVATTCYDTTILEGATTTLNVRAILDEDGGPATRKIRMAIDDGAFFEPAPLGTLIR